MNVLRRHLSRLGFFLAWPSSYFYLNHGSERTRILVVHGDDVLVSVNWMSDGRWSLPGGGLHKDEDRLAGALRELREETGLTPTADQLEFLCSDEFKSYGLRFRFHCYVWRCDEKLPLKRQLHEIAEQRWINYRQLHARNAGPDALIPVQTWFTS